MWEEAWEPRENYIFAMQATTIAYHIQMLLIKGMDLGSRRLHWEASALSTVLLGHPLIQALLNLLGMHDVLYIESIK